ncbi:MAG: GldG family protein [Myxococcaceae bacterium]|jgi:gliding-associated putative ABC transporter substrate-binding component GldG|nr:GldG family protein [Myxococcaceae bacterium]
MTRTISAVFIAAVLGILVLVNALGLRLFGRVDVTREKAYTLSKATKDTLSALEEPVVVTAYFTEQLPAPYSSNARYVRDLLEEFRAVSKGKVAFEFVDPQSQETDADKEAKKEVKQDIFGRRFRDQTSIEKELSGQGIQPVEIRVIEEDQQQTKRAYMAIVIKHQEKKEVIPLVQNVSSLEYDLTTLVRKLTRAKTPVIGVLQGHGEPKLDEKYRYLLTMLSQMYEVRPVELAGKDRFDDTLDALYVMGPKTALPANELKAIDQFLMKGKAVAFFLDQVQVDVRTFQPSDASHGMTELLSSYGVTVGNRLVADVKSGNVSISERRGFMVINQPVPYPFLPVVQRLEGDSVITAGLGDVLFPFVTSLEVKQVEGTTATVLARSSTKSWLENTPPNLNPQRDWRAESITPTGPYPLMAQVSGTLKSHYAAEAAQSAPGVTPVIGQSEKEARVIVVGTSALFQDDFMQNRGNQVLALNIADWLLLDPALLAMRNRGLALPVLQSELSDSTRNLVKFGNAFGLPLLLAAFGLVRWRMREASRATVTV